MKNTHVYAGRWLGGLLYFQLISTDLGSLHASNSRQSNSHHGNAWLQESTLIRPRDELSAQGAKVDVAAPEAGEIKGWRDNDWCSSITADTTLEEVKVGEYDALVLAGGRMLQDALRIDDTAIAIIKAFLEMGKVVAAMCHAPALLIEAGAVKGREV